MRRQPLERVTLARIAGLASLAALLVAAVDGARRTSELATDGIAGARADYEYHTCLEAELRDAVPRGSVVLLEEEPAWWWAPQRLVEWANPELLVVTDRDQADVVIGIEPAVGGCGNGRIKVEEP